MANHTRHFTTLSVPGDGIYRHHILIPQTLLEVVLWSQRWQYFVWLWLYPSHVYWMGLVHWDSLAPFHPSTGSPYFLNRQHLKFKTTNTMVKSHSTHQGLVKYSDNNVVTACVHWVNRKCLITGLWRNGEVTTMWILDRQILTQHHCSTKYQHSQLYY